MVCEREREREREREAKTQYSELIIVTKRNKKILTHFTIKTCGEKIIRITRRQ